MGFFLVYAETLERAAQLKQRLVEMLIDLDHFIESRVHITIPTNAVLVSLGITRLPAVLWVAGWPDDFLILSQGYLPDADEVGQWFERYHLKSCTDDEEVRALIVGRIVDRSSGRPLVGAWVRVRDAPVVGGGCTASTDLDGWYELPIARPGGMFLEFCWIGEQEVNVERGVVIEDGERLQVDIQLDARGSTDEDYDVVTGEFSGRFCDAFESCLFVLDEKCVLDSRGQARKVDRAWVEFSASARRHQLKPEVNYQIRCTGTLVGPGSFGHLGSCDYVLHVSELLEYRQLTPQFLVDAFNDLEEEIQRTRDTRRPPSSGKEDPN
jgi:hypothetical protein